MRGSLLFEASNFIKKETLVQVFSCEICEISKNTSFYRTPLVAASVLTRNLEQELNYVKGKKSFHKNLKMDSRSKI